METYVIIGTVGGKGVTEEFGPGGRLSVMPRRPVMRKKSRLLEPCRVLEFPLPRREVKRRKPRIAKVQGRV